MTNCGDNAEEFNHSRFSNACPHVKQKLWGEEAGFGTTVILPCWYKLGKHGMQKA
jgi:hypothetical protein